MIGKNSDKQRTVVVLGMHRSGTSAITNVLSIAGLYCGDDKDIVPKDKFNEKGYYERREVGEQNEDILDKNFYIVTKKIKNIQSLIQTTQLTGYGWVIGAWNPVLEQIQNKSKPEKHLNEYVANIREQANGRDIVLKDPRFSLTLPVWKPYLSNALIVMMIRDPDEVSCSLMVRNEFSDYISQPLWASYNRSALRVTAKLPRILINYSDLINNPCESITRLFGFLEKNGIVNIWEKLPEAINIISPKLYHSKADDQLSLHRMNSTHSKRYFENIILNQNNLGKVEELSLNGADDLISDYWLRLAITFLSRTVISQKLSQKLEECQRNYTDSIERLNRHPVAGPVINILRFLKKDSTFGSVISGDNRDCLKVK